MYFVYRIYNTGSYLRSYANNRKKYLTRLHGLLSHLVAESLISASVVLEAATTRSLAPGACVPIWSSSTAARSCCTWSRYRAGWCIMQQQKSNSVYDQERTHTEGDGGVLDCVRV